MFRIGSCPELDGRVGNVAFMGSPTVSTEKLVAGHELLAAVCSMQKLINKGELKLDTGSMKGILISGLRYSSAERKKQFGCR